MAANQNTISVLFVCLGNICRSTMAEGVFRSIVSQGPYRSRVDKLDSCGTAGYHVGSPPDGRTMSTLRKNGIADYVHSGRQLCDADFTKFDYIFAMDKSNLHDIEARRRRLSIESEAKVMMWGAYSGRGGEPEVVDDPYYGGAEGFDKAYRQCTRFSRNFLRDTFPGLEVGDSSPGRHEAGDTSPNLEIGKPAPGPGASLEGS